MNFHKWVWNGGKLETWFLYFPFPALLNNFPMSWDGGAW
jgi:hypothetical protein